MEVGGSGPIRLSTLGNLRKAECAFVFTVQHGHMCIPDSSVGERKGHRTNTKMGGGLVMDNARSSRSAFPFY